MTLILKKIKLQEKIYSHYLYSNLTVKLISFFTNFFFCCCLRIMSAFPIYITEIETITQ